VEAKLQEYYDKAKAKGACQEALEVIRKAGTVEELLKDKNIAEYLYWYAHYVIKDRWPEAEPYIVKDAMHACLYAENVLGHRWREAEPHIMKDPYWSDYYAVYVMDMRWPEAEPLIKNSDSANKYCQYFDITREEMDSGS
jgi:hypothetical protein